VVVVGGGVVLVPSGVEGSVVVGGAPGVGPLVFDGATVLVVDAAAVVISAPLMPPLWLVAICDSLHSARLTNARTVKDFRILLIWRTRPENQAMGRIGAKHGRCGIVPPVMEESGGAEKADRGERATRRRRMSWISRFAGEARNVRCECGQASGARCEDSDAGTYA
jgi:hypothetical protein